jgi:pimeloyl-ACP methyl ester carboxylesterase
MSYFSLENDVKLYYEALGQGRPLVFIHGVWMSSRFFQKQMFYFGHRYRSIAVDLRGHGRSTHVHSGHTVAQYARDVRALIRGLGLEEVVLIGWSMGAFVVWDYFKQFGAENLGATVVIDESASDYKWPDWSIGFADFPGLCHIMSTVQTDRDSFVKEFIPLMFKNPPTEEETKWMFEEITNLPVSVASAIFFDQTVQDYRPVLPRINVPTLLCFGGDEKLIPVEAGQHLERTLPDARLVIFENSSHCPFLEEPDRFNDELERFVLSLG